MVGRVENGPPPSTYAAQIVDNIESARLKTHSSGSRPHLKELLHRVLDADRRGIFADGAFDSSLEVNHKLICVILRACLSFPNGPNPFDIQGDVYEQARDSLAVIQLTIRRGPEVLWVSPQGEGTYGKPEGPLFLRLVPCLLNLLHHRDGLDIRNGAQQVLETILNVQRKPSGSKQTGERITKYVQGCIDDLLEHFEVKIQANRSASIQQIPTESTIAKAVSPTVQVPLITAKVHHKDLLQSLAIVVRCLVTLVTWSKTRSQRSALSLQRWMIGTAYRARSLITWKSVSVPRTTFEFMCVDMIEVAHQCFLCLSESRAQSVSCSFAIDVVSQTIADLLMISFEAGGAPLSDETQKSICWSLNAVASMSCNNSLAWRSYHQHLDSLVFECAQNTERLEKHSKDFQRSLALTTSIFCSTTGSIAPELFDFDDLNLRRAFESALTTMCSGEERKSSMRPSKRARGIILDEEQPTARSEDFHDSIRRLLGLTGGNPASILLDINNNFLLMSEAQQCVLLDSVGKQCCVPSSLDLALPCNPCDSQAEANSDRLYDSLSRELFEILSAVVKLCQEQKAPRPRIAAMLALDRFFMHTSQIEHFDLRASALAQWTLQSLRSSIRDLRLTAIRAASHLILDRLPPMVRKYNRVQTLDVLRALSEKDDFLLQETCILALSCFARRIEAEEETNLIFLRLIEYLGHTNPFVSNLAYEELQNLFSHNANVALRMLEPYWPTLAVTVVRDLQKRPQICQLLCDLLGMGVPDFLRMTQYHTIPFLVLTKRRDLLQRIADANGPSHNIVSICLEKEQLAAILTCLLLQPSPEPGKMIIALLSEASPGFGNIDLQEVLKSDPTRIVCELLKAAGEPDEDIKQRARQGIHVLAERIQRKGSKKYGAVAIFFEESALGIIQLLSEVISQTKGPQQLRERKRCISAMQEMATIAKSHLCNALPQITSCLRSTIEEGTLSNEAFGAWMTLATTLDEEDVENLIDPTFAIVAQHWDLFDPDVQQKAHDMISSLLKTHSSMIRDMVNTIPSLADIPLLKKFETELSRLKAQLDPKHQFQAFVKRCQSENVTVVSRALTELYNYLQHQQSFLHTSAISEQPDPVIAVLVQSLLGACLKFSEIKLEVAVNASKCLGMVGGLDSTKIELPKESKDILVLSDFTNPEETIDFVIFFLREVLVNTFLSTTDTRSQGLLAYAIQELLRNCGFDASNTLRRDLQPDEMYRRWISIPEVTRNTLTPFLTSKYVLEPLAPMPQTSYPIYSPEMSHSIWIRSFVFDLLGKCHGKNASMVFSIGRRIVRRQDISVSTFILPFIILNIILEGSGHQLDNIAKEFLGILSRPLSEGNQAVRENLILCSHDVFRALDYLSRWVQEKKKEIARFKALVSRGRELSEEALSVELTKLYNVEHFLGRIPANVLSDRAIDCRSFSRALFHWEEYIREQQARATSSDQMELLYQRLQDIYQQIDEPDGIEGISTHMHVITVDQQVLEHRKAGRWTAVQSWFELELNENPSKPDVQLNLLTSLKESGQYDSLLNQIASFQISDATSSLVKPFAAEAAWMTGRWADLEEIMGNDTTIDISRFDVGIGSALLSLYHSDSEQFSITISTLRSDLAKSMSQATIASIQSSHEAMLKFQVLSELEEIAGIDNSTALDRESLTRVLHQRLNVVGALASDKQYLLGLRRAAMQASSQEFTSLDMSSSWLASAKLARKGNFTHQAFNAVLHATQLGDQAATIETARLLWKEGHYRKAIQSLEGAIAANAFQSEDTQPLTDSLSRSAVQGGKYQNPIAARAHLLLAKWIDYAGQTQSDAIIKQYRTAVDLNVRSEKGHYYLGKHYNKLLESEKAKLPAKQAQTFITGEMAKLVIENYLRSLGMGAKYIHQTLPRILTLWLDLGTDIGRPIDSKYGNDHSFREHINSQRQKIFNAVMAQIKKYIDRLPPFVFYTAFAQIVARICHSHERIHSSLVDIVAKVVVNHPQQAVWTLLALVKSKKQEDRVSRGREVWTKVQENAKKLSSDTHRAEVITLMKQGQKLSDQLLSVCNYDVGKHGAVSLSSDLGFSHSKSANCRLAIPIETTLTATLPTATENMKTHKAFSKDTVAIEAFLDDALVLNSLIKPKKVNIRGSDGRIYGVMCKPKDDLRKDQRLLEFNSMITKILKKDAECSKRRLYIKTYAVTPLNEECGLIEWVEGVRTLRDILLDLYRAKGQRPDYSAIKGVLDEVSNDREKIPKFYENVLADFAPVFHEWFVDMFPEPSAWFEARLRYTRSCAVMSIVGHVLGLGDRHGENILFQGENGGTFHVDFNCLFDKGLTFEKPERVPFRLTHNMVDAFGAYGYEGPFRKSCELTLGILRQHEHTLMTILETFLYDPTTDFIGKKRRTASIVPDTPEGVLEAIRTKVRGQLPGESVPLSVEGHVQLLIQDATDAFNLARMYIGWCPFF